MTLHVIVLYILNCHRCCVLLAGSIPTVMAMYNIMGIEMFFSSVIVLQYQLHSINEGLRLKSSLKRIFKFALNYRAIYRENTFIAYPIIRNSNDFVAILV